MQEEKGTLRIKPSWPFYHHDAREWASIIIMGICLGLLPTSANGADTVETWDAGATDVEFYAGFDGIGRSRYERSVCGSMMLGYGLVNRLSAYFGATLLANEVFSGGSAELHLGIFGTPVDTDHFDLDLFLDVGAGGPVFDAFMVTPAMEFNLDLEPNRAKWGIYARAGLPLFGRPSEDDPAKHMFAANVELTVGTYVTIQEHHQLLFEYDMIFRIWPTNREDTVEVGGVALGYNVVVHDAIELVNQVYLDIPGSGAPIAAGIMIGFIATLPSTP